MKLFWLYIEPFTFLWQKQDKGIIYNSLSHKLIEFENIGLVQRVVKELLDVKNLYCIKITEIQLCNKNLSSFISNVVDSNSGGMFDVDYVKTKPAIIPPYPRVFVDKKHITKNGSLNVSENLIGLNIYINGDCELNCPKCSSLYKEVLHCTKSDFSINFELLEDVFNQIGNIDLAFINLLGGNISKYKDLDRLIDLMLINSKLSFNVYIDYQNITIDFLNIITKAHNCKLFVYFDVSTLEFINEKEDTNILLKLLNSNYDIISYVNSEKEYRNFISFFNKYEIKQFSFIPTNSNSDFFKKYVYISKSDLHDIRLTRKEIFANQIVNSNNFGILNILPDSKVYTNFKLKSIGSIEEDSVKSLIFKSFNNESSWFFTRDQVEPCRDCVYCYLCPPPRQPHLKPK